MRFQNAWRGLGATSWVSPRTEDPSFPGTLVPIDLNVTPRAQTALDELSRQYSFDGVVNNVGLARLAPLGQIDVGDVDDLFRMNVHPAIVATQAILPTLREKGWGRIVNVTSLVVTGTPLRSGYAAAKAALNSLTRTWAMELAGTGVTVNAVALGPVETELFRRNTPVGSEGEARFLSMIPMRRLGRPEEIAAANEFLLSEDAGADPLRGWRRFDRQGGGLIWALCTLLSEAVASCTDTRRARCPHSAFGNQKLTVCFRPNRDMPACGSDRRLRSQPGPGFHSSATSASRDRRPKAGG